MPYEVWLPGLTYREKIVNYNSLKVLADLEKERNFMHIGCKNLFVKAAFWYSGYQCGTNDFRKSFVIMEMLLFYITERYSVQFEQNTFDGWRDDLAKIKKKKTGKNFNRILIHFQRNFLHYLWIFLLIGRISDFGLLIQGFEKKHFHFSSW